MFYTHILTNLYRVFRRGFVVLTPVNWPEEHGRCVDELHVEDLDGVDGGDREGGRLLVRVVQLVEVLVQLRQVVDAMGPVG